MSQQPIEKPRILLLLPTRTYRATDFLAAAMKLNVEVVIASEEAATTADLSPRDSLVLDFSTSTVATQAILEFAKTHPIAAVVGVDDDTTLLATTASEALGLPHNPIESAKATRDKYRLRYTLATRGVPCPMFRRFSIHDDVAEVRKRVNFPCVIKPLSLSASRGVIRADNPDQFTDAFQRVTTLLHALEEATDTNVESLFSDILVEDYIPGIEVALEGILLDGELKTLALFDKPDPLEGPFFEETLYITPSRLSTDIQNELQSATADAAAALGLHHGPVHAELRYNAEGARLIEIAARTIGGL